MATSNQTDRPCPKCPAKLHMTLAGFFPAVICPECGYSALVVFGNLGPLYVEDKINGSP